MLSWLQKAGYTPDKLGENGIKFIHVAGTKGKGSVCAMIEKIMVQYQQTDKVHARGRKNNGGTTKKNVSPLCRIGVFTSPHLVTPRERIRIDGKPISKAMFRKYFWEIWNRLSMVAQREGDESVDPFSAATKPNYFRFLTIMALHCFVEEQVCTAIVECGIGGEYDSTNILPKELVAVSAITSIGIDHVGMLGDNIAEIAWHKAGIMREGVPAFTVEQNPVVGDVLEKVAAERGTALTLVKEHEIIKGIKLKLGLEGEHQKSNASLAIAATKRYMNDTMAPLGQLMKKWKLPHCFAAGLRSVNLPGRCHVRQEGNIKWLIDGAHTLESIEATAKWFVSKMRGDKFDKNPPAAMWLIFNQQRRDPVPLLKHLLMNIRSRTARFANDGHKFNFDTIGVANNHSVTERLQQVDSDDEQWNAIQESGLLEGSKAMHAAVSDIMHEIRSSLAVVNGERVVVLVTGSLHTAGRVLLGLNKRYTSRTEKRREQMERVVQKVEGERERKWMMENGESYVGEVGQDEIAESEEEVRTCESEKVEEKE